MGLNRAGFGVLSYAFAAVAAAEGWYLGASAGLMDADFEGVDDATNAGLLLGYDVYTKEIFSASIEAEFTTTVSDGDLEASGSKGDWDIDTQAAYLASPRGTVFWQGTVWVCANRCICQHRWFLLQRIGFRWLLGRRRGLDVRRALGCPGGFHTG